ncbi:exosome complex RNA-binding protein 1/RRP40/RRP4, partial [Kipferlia bialata]
NYMRGHGTRDVTSERGGLEATVIGHVELIDMYGRVKPLRGRYTAETGQLVIGRVVDVLPRKWAIDIKGAKRAMLALSSIILPGGEQRRRSTLDELNIRRYFAESDVVCAEVRSVSQGVPQLHTRSTAFGKLSHGYLMDVPHHLIVPVANVYMGSVNKLGMGVILGANGCVWLSAVRPHGGVQESMIDGATSEIDEATRKGIARCGNVIRWMVKEDMPISIDSINKVVDNVDDLAEFDT